MARVGLMLLTTAVNLALMVNVAKASGFTVDWGTNYEWQAKYKDLREKSHRPEEYPGLVDDVIKSLKGSYYDSPSTEDELMLLQRMHLMDLQLCSKKDLLKLTDLASGYLVHDKFRRHLKDQEEKLRQKCSEREIDELKAQLNDEDGELKQSLEMVQLLANYVNPAGKVRLSEEDSDEEDNYSRQNHQVAPGIADYLIKRAKDDGKPQSWFPSKQEFEDLYKSQVTDICQDWIIATSELHDLAQPTMYPESIVEIWLDYRSMCQDIKPESEPGYDSESEMLSEALKGQVYYKLWEKLAPK